MRIIKRIIHYVKQFDFKKHLYLLLCGAFVSIFFLMIAIRLGGQILPYATHLENRDEEQFIRNLTSGKTIEQNFVSPHDFDCLTISASNHEKILEGKTLVQLWNTDTQELIISQEIKNSSIEYAVPVEIHLSEIGMQDVKYTIKIQGLDTGEEAIGFFGYQGERGVETALIDGEESNYVLSIGTHTHTKLFFGLFIAVFAIMLIGLVILLICLLYKRITQPEQVFLMFAVPMGLAFLCFMSVNFIHDGDAHFARAYHYSNTILGIWDENPDKAITMRKEDAEIVFDSKCMNAKNAQNMWHIFENWKWFAEDKNLVQDVECRSAGITNILLYLPSVLGILLARILGLGAYPMLYFGKIIPMAMYLIGVYYAIKLIPIGKHLMVFTAALPMAMQQSTGITYDNVTLTVLFLFIAYAIRLYYMNMKKYEWVVFTILCILLGCCKGGIYTPMMILLLFIPKSRMKGLKRKIVYITGVGVFVAAVTLMNYSTIIRRYVQIDMKTVQSTATDEYGLEEVIKEKVQTYGIGLVIREPLKFVKLFMTTIMDWGDEYVRGMLGNGVAWAVEKLPVWAYMFFGVILLLSKNGMSEEKYKVNRTLKLAFLMAFLLVFGAYHILFLIETPITYSYIWGIQGRYFLPLSILLLLVFRNNEVKQEKGSEHLLYIGYYFEMMLFLYGYFQVFMTQTYL